MTTDDKERAMDYSVLADVHAKFMQAQLTIDRLLSERRELIAGLMMARNRLTDLISFGRTNMTMDVIERASALLAKCDKESMGQARRR